MKRIRIKKIAIFMAFIISLSSINFNAFASKDSLMEDGSFNEQTTKEWDGITTIDEYVVDGYKVVFSLKEYWESGYNAEISIENTGEEIIHNWMLEFEYPQEITNMWNAEVIENDSGTYRIKNVDWNQDLRQGETVSVGLSSQKAFINFPQKYKLISSESKVNSNDLSVSYKVNNWWPQGFAAEIILKNESENPIEDWIFEFDFDNSITEMWNANIESADNNHYLLEMRVTIVTLDQEKASLLVLMAAETFRKHILKIVICMTIIIVLIFL